MALEKLVGDENTKREKGEAGLTEQRRADGVSSVSFYFLLENRALKYRGSGITTHPTLGVYTPCWPA